MKYIWKGFFVVCLICFFALNIVACSSDNEIHSIYMIIEEEAPSVHLVYDNNTNIVYRIIGNQYDGGFVPYLINDNGIIYGAIYENGEIVKAPFATTINIQDIIDSLR